MHHLFQRSSAQIIYNQAYIEQSGQQEVLSVTQMSKRSEIRQKEQLQLQLQAQFNKLDQTVLSWLSKPTEKSKTNIPVLTESSTRSGHLDTYNETSQFANQIVIPSGKGINFSDSSNNDDGKNNSSVVTINDFLDTVTLRKKTANGKWQSNARDGTTEKINKVVDVKRRNGSSASLRALTNKLRNDRREKLKGNVRKVTPVSQFGSKNKDIKESADSDSESDGDDEILHRKSKNSKVSAKVGKNKRPF